MRPIRLTMQAFGPYAGRETVDFREALENGLFGIYGPTGSGKSTIFSAMTFALFGEAAKSDQETSTLRSDHAVADCPTEVEFVFEVGDRRYLIRRRPEQMRPKQRGEGETKDQHEAWFFDATGINVDAISAVNCGKIIAEKKVGAVKAAVAQHLGYGAEQFKQIVLLPQGKFETFLTAKTDERLKILRELFDVSLYKRLAVKMKEDARAAEEAVRRDREVCARRLEQEEFESPDALQAGIAEAKQTHVKILARAKELHKKAQEAETQLSKATQLDAKFREHESATNELEMLGSKTEQVRSWTTTLRDARIAHTLLDVEAAEIQAESDVRNALNDLNNANKNSETAQSKAERAKTKLSKEKEKASEIELLRHNGHTLAQFSKTLEAAESLKGEVHTAKTVFTAAARAFDAADKKQKNLTKNQSNASRELQAARNAAEQRGSLTAQVEAAKQSLDLAITYEKADKALTKAREQLTQASAGQAKKVAAAKTAQKQFDAAEAALAGAQAQHLAEKLVEGAPCPVCGSIDHPSPTKGTAESAGLDRAFRDAKTALDGARQSESSALAEVSSAKTKVQERQSSIDAIQKPEQNAQSLREIVDTLEDQIEALGPIVDVGQLEGDLENIEADIEKTAEAVDRARTTKQKADTDLALANQKLEGALSAIPVELQDEEALAAAIAVNEKAIEAKGAARQEAEEEEQAAREHALGAKKDAESAERAHEVAFKRLEAAQTTFANRLDENGMTVEQYHSNKAKIADIKTLDVAITAHEKALAIAKEKVNSTSKEIKGVERPNLEILKQAGTEAIEARDAANAEAAKAEARVSQLKRLLSGISAELKRIEKFERKTASLRDLAAVFNANNHARLDLETFAIGAMFDQVLRAANMRLGPMTSGRYTLEREVEGGKGIARRGLGICVNDIYTGRPRATSTLSGGETFIAALALALGLSDIVESVSGGIRLDTIFIDEGFGSLDTENDAGTLDQVLQTLTDLVGQNRAVGLISHVSLVQQSIPNGFWISKKPSGSHVEERGVLI